MSIATSTSGADNHFDIFAAASVRAAQPFYAYKHGLYAFMCLLWLLFGLFGRDPWKPEETLLVAALVSADGAVVFPPLAAGGLYLWLAAACAWATESFLPVHEGARLANAVLLSLSGWMVWRCLYKEFGVRLAWLAVLLLFGSVGLVIRGHLLNDNIFELFAVAGVVWGVLAWKRGEQRHHVNLLSGLWVALNIGFLLVGNHLLLALCLTAAVFIFLFWASNRLVFGLIISVFLLSLFAWKFVLMDDGALVFAAMQEKWRAGGLAMLNHTIDMVRIVGWSLFPVLPLAVVGLVSHHRKRAAWLAVEKFCCLLCALILLCFYLEGDEEEDLYMLLPPLAVITAMLLKSIHNEVARLLDLFAVLVIGLICTGGIWLVWLALQTGFPAFLLAYLNEEWAGFALPMVSWWKVGAAVVLVIAWLLMVQKFGISKERAIVNWMCSITLAWVSFNLLLVGYVDSGKSYRFPVQALQESLRADVANEGAGQGACVQPLVAGRHWRAQLHYYGVSLGDESCHYYFTRAEQASAAEGKTLIWSGGRGGGRAKYHLYRRF